MINFDFFGGPRKWCKCTLFFLQVQVSQRVSPSTLPEPKGYSECPSLGQMSMPGGLHRQRQLNPISQESGAVLWPRSRKLVKKLDLIPTFSTLSVPKGTKVLSSIFLVPTSRTLATQSSIRCDKLCPVKYHQCRVGKEENHWIKWP